MDTKEIKKAAMLKAIKMLKKEMQDEMFSGIPKKKTSVTVAGDSPEAVKEGLQKADELLSKKDLFKEAFLASKKPKQSSDLMEEEEDMDEDSMEEEEDMEEDMEECPMCKGNGCKMCDGGVVSK